MKKVAQSLSQPFPQTVAIDIHAHALIAEVEQIARSQERWSIEVEEAARLAGDQSSEHNRRLMQTAYLSALTRVEARIAAMDAMRIDVQAVSPIPSQYHYWSNRGAAR